MKINIHKAKNIHFIGIGGIGVSALAKMFLLEGRKVSGSDLEESLVTQKLKKEEATIYIGHRGGNIMDSVDLVIYTIAVQDRNTELAKAIKLKIPIISYPEALGLITKDKYTIAVSGTHGKTTTTAMVSNILIAGKKDPTVVVGSLLTGKNDNFIGGEGDLLVTEACEYRRSFLNLHPKILVITNIDNDHLDYFKDIEDIKKAFRELVRKIPEDGFLVLNTKGEHMHDVVKTAKCSVFDYGKVKLDFNLKVIGKHNRDNAKAAFVVGEILNVPQRTIKKALENFSGTWRRTELKGRTTKGGIVYDDYAHHPSEIKATLSGLREKFLDKKITVIFQPHLYSRTKILLDDFSKSFNDADEIIVAPIYAAREKKNDSISSKILAERLRKNGKSATFFPTLSEIEKFTKRAFDKDDLVITMGAGDIYRVSDGLVK